MLFEIMVTAFDYDDFKRELKSVTVMGKKYARLLARDFAKAINVIDVIVTDSMTGEIIVSYTNGEITWESAE